jgi:hypothetical protein
MPCSHCGENGHNRRTCPLLVNIHRDLDNPPQDNPPQEPHPPLDQNNMILFPHNNINQRWFNDIIINDFANENNQNNEINQNNDRNEFGTINKIDISIHNMKDVNYTLYLVSGNMTIWNLDTTENDLHYLGICVSNSTFDMKRCVGARVLVIPHGRSIEHPGFHPPTDKKLWEKPYCVIDIKESHIRDKNIYIDNGNQLSELNKWKFNALKLDFLLKEVIKLGGKNYDNLEPILDLHQDIQLNDHSEFEKERSGIPSTFTNIT